MTNQTMTHEQEQGAWPHLTKMIREYIDDYHLEGDEGSYIPTGRERFIAEDVINSMLVDDEMADVISAALSRPAVPEGESVATVKAERDALQRENAELRERVRELEADAAMLDQMQDECWNVECEAYPIADSGDSDIEWRVFSSHMAEPRRREIGYGRTPREALNAAMQEGKS